MSADPLDKPMQYLKGVGAARARLFERLGVFSLRDLLNHFPREYEDRRETRLIAQMTADVPACVAAMVAEPVRYSRIRAGLDIAKTRIVDESGCLSLTFFNAPYVREALREGETYVFFGKLTEDTRNMQNPVFEHVSRAGQNTGCILPVYRLCAGLSRGQVTAAVRQTLRETAEQTADILPDGLQARYQLAHSRFAYEKIHFPNDPEEGDTARRRLVFEELLVLSLGLRQLKGHTARLPGRSLSPAGLDELWAALPYEPTGAQRRIVGQALSDMASGHPMNRLVQGDVGSGKTLVAAACAVSALRGGVQVAFMAPTELLAEQHFETLAPLFERLGLTAVLLTGGLSAHRKRAVCEVIESGAPLMAVGTHALLSDRVRFGRLGLVIADEQHRFGVAQRAALLAKGDAPHLLTMSATPIPRTLALIVYGDLDVSVLDEMPPGRRAVDTFVVGEDTRPRIEAFVKRLVAEGRQVYVVCPRVEENDDAQGLRAVEEYAARLREAVFPGLRVGWVHGRLKGRDKETAMRAFAAGKLDILVATTVIEVGINVPNAALMVVENADRFGLSALHQLRGRVGRGAYKSYCVLFSEAQGETARARLRVMRETNDGFAVAERDLALRGPGDFFGQRQHGLPNLHIADLATDMYVLPQAGEAAQTLLEEDPGLERHPGLRAAVARLFAGGAAPAGL
jgi:ATP-dependent DNA helicase RecG